MATLSFGREMDWSPKDETPAEKFDKTNYHAICTEGSNRECRAKDVGSETHGKFVQRGECGAIDVDGRNNPPEHNTKASNQVC